MLSISHGPALRVPRSMSQMRLSETPAAYASCFMRIPASMRAHVTASGEWSNGALGALRWGFWCMYRIYRVVVAAVNGYARRITAAALTGAPGAATLARGG